MLVSVDNKIVNARNIVDIKVEEFYQEAYDCEAGCECENIHLEYDQLIAWEDAAKDRIAGYTKNLNGLIANE